MAKIKEKMFCPSSAALSYRLTGFLSYNLFTEVSTHVFLCQPRIFFFSFSILIKSLKAECLISLVKSQMRPAKLRSRKVGRTKGKE